MSKQTQKKLFPLLLSLPLLLVFIIQALACNDDACSTSNPVCFQDEIYIERFYTPDPQEISHINVAPLVDKFDNVTAYIKYNLFDNKKDFLYSDTCLCLNDVLNRHLDFPDNHTNQSIQKKKILYQSADNDPLPLT